MSKYYLTLVGIDKEKTIEFNKIEGYESYDCYSLRDIDKFTSQFNNVDELKNFLAKNNIIDYKHSDKSLRILYNYKKEEKNLKYGVVYKDNYKLFDIKRIKNYLYDNLENYDLLEEMCNQYEEAYMQEENIDSIRRYIRFFSNNDVYFYSMNSEKNQMIKECKEAIDKFVFRITTRYIQNQHKSVENYRPLRDLAMFLNYQQKLKEQSLELERLIEEHRNETEEFLTEEDYERTNGMEECESNIQKNKVKVKTKNINMTGQLTFKDMGW